MPVLGPSCLCYIDGQTCFWTRRKNAVKTAQVMQLQGLQAVKLPDDFRFDSENVRISRQGDAVILQPMKSAQWPATFFEDIRIDDPAFCRPDQGQTPPAPTLT